ncbi:MAG: class B sortase [Lachnospiraceae bacterium]|nr:class B sortase [Lachnospiraceae bacterium]
MMEKQKKKWLCRLQWVKKKVSGIKAVIPKTGQGRGIILASLFLVVAGGIGIFAAGRLRPEQPEKTNGKQTREVRTLSVDEEEVSKEIGVGTVKPEEMHEKYEGLPEIDFQKLWEINPDICAWICIPETLVNAPVLRNGDSEDPHDEYYLDTTVEGEKGLPGSIYMEPCNSPEFTDFNTVVYGHNMKNGTMFGELDELEQEEFFEAHEFIYMLTPDRTLRYRIFGWVNYDDRHIMLSFDFSQEAQCQAFLDSFQEVGRESRFREDMKAAPTDRILTLSTCVKDQEDRRFLVEAVLVDMAAR